MQRVGAAAGSLKKASCPSRVKLEVEAAKNKKRVPAVEHGLSLKGSPITRPVHLGGGGQSEAEMRRVWLKNRQKMPLNWKLHLFSHLPGLLFDIPRVLRTGFAVHRLLELNWQTSGEA